MDDNGQNGEDGIRPITPAQVLGSVAASAFGVQSRRNRERDFSRGNPWHFVLAGLVFTGAFVGVLVLVVRMVAGG